MEEGREKGSSSHDDIGYRVSVCVLKIFNVQVRICKARDEFFLSCVCKSFFFFFFFFFISKFFFRSATNSFFFPGGASFL